MGAVSAKEPSKRDKDSTSFANEDPPSTIDLEDLSARIDTVHFDGISRTKLEILKHSVRGLFSASSFKEVIAKSQEAKVLLHSMGLFKNILIFVDTSSGPNSTPNGYEVTFKVTEYKRFSGGVTSQLSNNEGVLVIGGFFPNINGRGEMIKSEFTFGSKKSNSIGVTFSKPLLFKPYPIGSFTLFGNSSDWPISGYKVRDTGCLFDLAFNSNHLVKHNLQYELDWRNIKPYSRTTSFEVIQDVGHKLKSCLRHIVTIDGRDSLNFPSNGSLLKLNTEFAGLGGNIGFLKNELNYQFNFPLYKKDFVFQLGLNAGHMLNFGNDFSLPDNFFLGGPQTLRGFEARGIGPQKDQNFLGGKMYYAAGLHLFTPLPFRVGNGNTFGDMFRTHLWLNAGNVGDFKTRDFDVFLQEQMALIRVSTGLGIAIRIGQMARFELNFCLPLLTHSTDKVVENVQIGVGMQFL